MSRVSTHFSRRRVVSWKRRIAYVAIIYLAFLLILLAVEGATRLLLPHVYSLDIFVNTPQQKAQVANPQHSGIFEGDPLLLWRLRPNLDRAIWDFTVVSTNAQHLRADRPIKAKNPDAIRIVCLGDSVTFGYRVPPVWPERPTNYDPSWLPYPMLLEKNLREANAGRGIEVITMAVPGYTSHQGLAWLRRDIDWLKPDLLIVSFGWNDASLSDLPDRETIKTDWYAVVVRRLIDRSQAFAHATQWLRSKGTPAVATSKPVPRVSEQEYLENMSEIVSLARNRGSGVIVIGAPYRDSIIHPSEAELMSRYRSALRSTMGQKQIHFLEIKELTESAHPSNQGWFGELIHPNHMGHRLMAAELLKVIEREQILKGISIPQLTP